jgi:hypothetical protein
MDSVVAHLLELAMAWTGYAMPAALPPLERPDARAMPCPCIGALVYPRRAFGYGAEMLAPMRLMLRSDVDLDLPVGRSILLHELVHVLQAQSGVAQAGSELWHAREREAHAVQQRYLRSVGVFVQPGWQFSMRDD